MVPSPTPPSSFHPATVVASCQRLSLPLGPCGAGPISAACSPTWTSTQQQPQQCCCSSSSPTPHPCTCFASHMHCQDLPPVANWGSFLICLFWGCEFEWIIGDLWSSFGVAGWGVLGVMIVGTMGQPLQVLLRATPPPQRGLQSLPCASLAPSLISMGIWVWRCHCVAGGTPWLYTNILGNQTFFVTMICNPYWDEVTSELFSEQTPQDCLELVARVYRANFEIPIIP
jgi:hypothetical protein